MTPDPINVDAAEAMLARLAGRDMTLAEHVHDCCLASEDPHEVAELAKAYRYAARSARQSIALHAKLKREREAAERAAAAGEPAPARTQVDWVRVSRRKAEVREAVRRVIWDETEAESEDEEALLSILENNLRISGERPDFHEPELDDHVVAVCARLRLPLAKALRWRELPDLPERDALADTQDGYETADPPAYADTG